MFPKTNLIFTITEAQNTIQIIRNVPKQTREIKASEIISSIDSIAPIGKGWFVNKPFFGKASVHATIYIGSL